jgi:hypothetical protein
VAVSNCWAITAHAALTDAGVVVVVVTMVVDVELVLVDGLDVDVVLPPEPDVAHWPVRWPATTAGCPPSVGAVALFEQFKLPSIRVPPTTSVGALLFVSVTDPVI